MKHLGLFEGIGGFSLAARWMGWETVAWCEINERCQQVLKKHFPNAVAHGDIKKESFIQYANKINIVTGGFPCKNTSTAAAIHGKRNGLEGIDSGLWYEELRVFKEIKSPWIIVENVAGVQKWENQISSGMESIGYTVSRLEYKAFHFGYPHQRRRFLYVGNSNGKRLESPWQKGSSSTEWQQRLAASGGVWLFDTSGAIGSFNGLPNRMDRVMQLGNSIIPDMAFDAFKLIQASEKIGIQNH